MVHYLLPLFRICKQGDNYIEARGYAALLPLLVLFFFFIILFSLFFFCDSKITPNTYETYYMVLLIYYVHSIYTVHLDFSVTKKSQPQAPVTVSHHLRIV